jgi:hypothetical protein
MAMTATTLAKVIAGCENNFARRTHTNPILRLTWHQIEIRFVQSDLTKTTRCTSTCNRYVSSATWHRELDTTGYSTGYAGRRQQGGITSLTNHQLMLSKCAFSRVRSALFLIPYHRSAQGPSRLWAPAKALDSGCLAELWRL